VCPSIGRSQSPSPSKNSFMTPNTFWSTSTEKNKLTSFYWIRLGNVKNGSVSISIPDSVDQGVDMVNVSATGPTFTCV
jgi:hypothetical protein